MMRWLLSAGALIVQEHLHSISMAMFTPSSLSPKAMSLWGIGVVQDRMWSDQGLHTSPHCLLQRLVVLQQKPFQSLIRPLPIMLQGRAPWNSMFCMLGLQQWQLQQQQLEKLPSVDSPARC